MDVSIKILTYKNATEFNNSYMLFIGLPIFENIVNYFTPKARELTLEPARLQDVQYGIRLFHREWTGNGGKVDSKSTQWDLLGIRVNFCGS